MKSLKHIGRINGSGAKVIVVFRTLPGESDHALVLPVSRLQVEDHDTIMSLIDTAQAQDAFEFGEIMFIRTFSDSRRMLQAANADNILLRVATDQIIMTPNTKDEILLSELNVLIAEQKNVAIDELYTFVKGAVKVDDINKGKETLGRDVGEPNIPAAQPVVTESTGVLSDAVIAKSMRDEANVMSKEALRLRKEANALDPKPAKAKATPKGTPKAESPAKEGKARAAKNAKAKKATPKAEA